MPKRKKSKNKRAQISLPAKEYLLSDRTYVILKWIAIMSMLIDQTTNTLSLLGIIPNAIYIVTGYIGRIAIPIFFFLLVECYHHTQNKGKHLLRLFILALISEVPYDYLRTGHLIDFSQQNAIYTLALAFAMLIISDLPIERLVKKARPKTTDDSKFLKAYMFLYKANVLGIFSIVSMLALCETSWYGVFFAGLLNLSRTKKHRFAWTALSFVFLILPTINYNRYSIAALIALPIIIIALTKGNKENGISKTKPIILQNKALLIVGRYVYPISLIILGIIAFILSNT